jgi:hypothetical protein
MCPVCQGEGEIYVPDEYDEAFEEVCHV